MAQVYKGVERITARQAQPGTIDHARRLKGVAAARLAERRSEGDSYVEVVAGRRSDAFVELVDPGPDGNAVAIEFGRSASSEHGATQGVYALAAAMGAGGG